jgi:S1-C subfamily serine protease
MFFFRATRSAAAALLLGGVLLPGAASAQQDPPPPPRRVKIMRADSMFLRSDSTFLRMTINAGQIEQMIHDLMASKALEQTIGQSLRDATSGQSSDPRKIRELSEELARIAQKRASLITTIEMTCAGDRQPEGYIGVQFSELQTVIGDDGSSAPPMREYPRIDSVYGNSPASRAGVHRGDVVQQIGGIDARRAVQLDKLLKIGTKLMMRVQRDGANKDLVLTIEKKPVDFNSDCANVDQWIGPEFDRPNMVMRAPRTPMAPGVGLIFPRTPTPASAPDAPMPPSGGFMYGFSTTTSAIAGATLMPLDDDWRATLGVDDGVLVTKVLPGTPAKDAGLRSSDVIISADGQGVASVRSLSRIVSNAKAKSVKLQVVRGGKPLVIMLRWQEQP